MSSHPSPGLGQQPLKSALKTDDEAAERSPAVKAVQIAEPEMTEIETAQQRPASPEDGFRKQFTAGLAKRLSGRLPAGSSRSSLMSNTSGDAPNSTASSTDSTQQIPEEKHHRHRHHFHLHARNNSLEQQQQQQQQGGHMDSRLVMQVLQWIGREKEKKESRRKKRMTKHRKSKSPPSTEDGAGAQASPSRPRADSIDSDESDVSLDQLQKIVDEGLAAMGIDPATAASATNPSRVQPRRRLSKHKSRSSLQLYRAVSSDTDYVDGDVLVPSCDAVLDNSKTLSYSGGKAASTEDLAAAQSRREEKERQAWSTFKGEILRLAHTLRLKGWRRVPLECGDGLTVERLSGALTNAVYVVSPPSEIVSNMSIDDVSKKPKKPPPKLLLRIYGPQVEQLIDREKELGVLKRLARKKIGPRMLGTFTNGRFEQYLNATTLTAANLREPETSKMIAKRMKELHVGVELLESELAAGPNVWVNWDSWLDAVERTVLVLDRKVLESPADVKDWRKGGLVCGVEWHVFKELVERYRVHLTEHYGGQKKIREKLVFAHNDTQYGNILRLRPDDEKSPLLQPANEHKQLVVIDFEYAAANTPGYEFANHFAEWTYNYHDAVAPHACNASRYPTPEQQRRFVRAYVDHNHPHRPSSSSSSSSLAQTPTMHATTSTSSIVDFMLDARVPPGGWKEEETRRDAESDAKIRALLEETRLWRPANSAQWVAWGIVQAKLPAGVAREVEAARKVVEAARKVEEAEKAEEAKLSDDNDKDELDERTKTEKEQEAEAVAEAVALNEEDAAAADEFDYLGYSRERAMFFLGDCVLMGLIKLEDLPEATRDKVKFVDY
ncbi:uncharacterized protein PpBr36_09417 [Pyricularia pennisetigena]|uniref:uncharacterized protein n=1 Tax=Pyricularia pennisetigena TaxID=1578925 RepID=UPI00115279CA|nr:uncharacterized protein PpBr36_09417 [Pyricularia pennisetigena]TLS21677.1 hypothetical protein PpBr36_09417 [Pyricularia pennisetigena]